MKQISKRNQLHFDDDKVSAERLKRVNGKIHEQEDHANLCNHDILHCQLQVTEVVGFTSKASPQLCEETIKITKGRNLTEPEFVS